MKDSKLKSVKIYYDGNIPTADLKYENGEIETCSCVITAKKEKSEIDDYLLSIYDRDNFYKKFLKNT